MTSVLKPKTQRKRRISPPVDPHGVESIGSILRRMRREAEAQMTMTFSRPLSLKIDRLLDEEQRLEEGHEI
jgi:hypothetical protein